jgi:hypothetical protein
MDSGGVCERVASACMHRISHHTGKMFALGGVFCNLTIVEVERVKK